MKRLTKEEGLALLRKKPTGQLACIVRMTFLDGTVEERIVMAGEHGSAQALEATLQFARKDAVGFEVCPDHPRFPIKAEIYLATINPLLQMESAYELIPELPQFTEEQQAFFTGFFGSVRDKSCRVLPIEVEGAVVRPGQAQGVVQGLEDLAAFLEEVQKEMGQDAHKVEVSPTPEEMREAIRAVKESLAAMDDDDRLH